MKCCMCNGEIEGWSPEGKGWSAYPLHRGGQRCCVECRIRVLDAEKKHLTGMMVNHGQG
jgi:hypothetical protein